MLLNNLSSLDTFQFMPHVFITCYKHYHECIWMTYNIKKIKLTLKHEKKTLVTLAFAPINVIALNRKLTLSRLGRWMNIWPL